MAASRRQFLKRLAGAGFALTPIAAALLTGCKPSTDLPEGMVEIKWDRDTCVRCSMVISDRRFAAQVRGGPKQGSYKFDDIGCVVHWLEQQEWGKDPAVRIWVADSQDQSWLDARKAWYVGAKTSPMGYNFAAVRGNIAGALDFQQTREHVLVKDK
jgi:nitrous oxide reductase accessory protein NosL